MRSRKRPVLEFFTTEKLIAEMYPPVAAGRCIPDWWRSTPAFVPENQRKFPHLRLRRDTTIKSCPGIHDYMNLGYVLPLWADMLIAASANGFDYEVTCKTNELAVFAPQTLGPGFPRRPGDHSHVLKIVMPWKVTTPKGWSIMVVQPPYHSEQRWSVLPGVVDTDRLPVINFIAEWHSPVGHAELLKAGTPLLQVIPFKRREALPLLVRKVGQQEWDDSYGPGIDAVAGERLAPGSYRENGRRQLAQRAR